MRREPRYQGQVDPDIHTDSERAGQADFVQPSATASRQHQDGSQSCPVRRGCPPGEVRASAGAA
ncbi:CCDC120 isoform 6 [Pan troglodytes]|uniref:CCDC120 isoform 6 n=1 Tax=Pan troglodytes TaxID=9598 RepID=A0A2J8IMX3_PANTR|nr:CCDC120 isoform 6 [Pan troglodytes]